MSTTIACLPDLTFFTAGAASLPITRVNCLSSVVLPVNFIVYLPFTAVTPNPTFTATALIAALDTPASSFNSVQDIPVWTDNGTNTSSIASPSRSIILTSGSAIYVPITSTLNTTVALSTLTARLDLFGLRISTSSSTSSIGSSSPIVSTVTPTLSIATASSSADRYSKPVFEGAVAGGAVGGLIVGILFGLLGFYCFRRRHTKMNGASRAAIRRKPIPAVYPQSDITQSSEGASAAVGWDKHVPQEKDDATIVSAVDAVLEQIEIHVEGFYKARAIKPSPQAMEGLARLSSDELPKMLLRTSDAVSILKAILSRWIVHRISLRSDVVDSLLPIEFTQIPKKNKWHMEADEHEDGSIKGRGKGLPQAFTAWRTLTGFLRSIPSTNDEWMTVVDAKIDRAVEVLTEAFAPWEISGKSQILINQNLRNILHQASDTGILLFTQPSTFMFQWSVKGDRRNGTVCVMPAFVRRQENSAEPSSSEQIMIKAKVMNS